MRLFLTISSILLLSISFITYADLSDLTTQSLKRKAKSGNPHAQLKLGNYALVHDHYHQAYKWFKRLSHQDDEKQSSKGFSSIGLLYMLNHGPYSKNYKKARYYFKKALKLGDKGVYGNLGGIYYDGGHGIKQDKQKAKHYYYLGAKHGDPSSQFNLASLYANQKQYKKSFHWYHKSAKQYYLSGMYVIGILYAIGKQGVTQDKVEGCKWFRLALKVYPNYQKAHYMLGKLMPTMDYTQKYACRQQVKRYLKNHNVPRKSEFNARLELKS